MVLEVKRPVGAALHARRRQVRHQAGAHADRAGAGAAAAVRRGERLVHVRVDDVDPHVAFVRAGLTDAIVDFHRAPRWLRAPMPSQIISHIELRADWTRIVDGVLFIRHMDRSHKE